MDFMEKTRQRFHLLDAYRGFVVLNMIAYHFCYDYFVLFSGEGNWIFNKNVYIWEQYICISFIFLSGFGWNFNTNHKLKRGLIVSFFGVLITLVTASLGPDIAIYYGVLFLLGASMLILIPLSKWLDKLPSVVVFLVALFMYLFTFSIPARHVGLHRLRLIKMPDYLYEHQFLVPVGFLKEGFVSADYFPIMPWFFLFVAGYAFNRVLNDRGFFEREEFLKTATIKVPILDFIGKHSLFFYIIHQPICMGILTIIF